MHFFKVLLLVERERKPGLDALKGKHSLDLNLVDKLKVFRQSVMECCWPLVCNKCFNFIAPNQLYP